MINLLIFISGLLVYAGYGLDGLIYLLGATLLSYIAGLLTPRRSWVMWLCVGIHALMLLAVKLDSVTGFGILAPLGISYFTLQLISYNVDVYKEKYPPEKNLYRFALFVTYMPHLLMGPIAPYDSMVPALFEERRMSWAGFFSGLARILWGLFKKLIIASRIAVIVGAISGDPNAYSGAYALCAVLLYSIELYSDFSGGIDMVLGISQILGIRLPENFQTPYFSETFQEFWRRWHMTLGNWLREYIYIPLGGNRKGRVRKVINLILTFLVSGLWHGVQYLLWGLFNGIFVALGDKTKTRWKTLNRAVTFLLVSLLWAFFVWPDMLTATSMLGSIFTTFNYGSLFASLGVMGLTGGDWIVLGAACLILLLTDWHITGLSQGFTRMRHWAKTAVICTLGLLVLVFGMYGIGFEAEAFIYGGF